jgi:hypothetical protein
MLSFFWCANLSKNIVDFRINILDFLGANPAIRSQSFVPLNWRDQMK